MAPRVSVLIPVYNCEAYIGAAIESVTRQSFTDWELIVVDDGSTDGSAREAGAFPGARVYRRPHNGISAARNYALEQAQGELIAFLDADDLWEQDKLERQVSYMDRHPGCEIVFCRYRNFTEIPKEQLTPQQKLLMNIEIDAYLTGALIRKDLFSRYGLFDTSYPHSEDTEMTARLRVAGVDMTHRLDRYLYLRRVHDGNITLTHGGMGIGKYYSMMANIIRGKWNREKETPHGDPGEDKTNGN